MSKINLGDVESLIARFSVLSDEEVARRRQEQSDAEEASARLTSLRESGIPLTDEMRRSIVNDGLSQTQALVVAQQWHESWATPKSLQVLVLIGRPGVGKGVAAAWVAARTHCPVYLKARALVSYHSASFGEERARYEQAVRTNFLVIDEVGTEQRESKSAIQDIIDDRIGNRRRTMLISNLSKAALLERLDERTVDRLKEIGRIVELKGKSLRIGSV